MFYRPIHFKLEELVSPGVFKTYGERAWEFLDDKLLREIDKVREYFDVPMTINNWHTKGTRVASGFRERGCMTGAECSQHRFGRAVDIICSIPARELRCKIMEKNRLFENITTLEDDVEWLHMDTRPREQGTIKLIKP